MGKWNAFLHSWGRRGLCVILSVFLTVSLFGCHSTEPEVEDSKVLRVIMEGNAYADTNGLVWQIVDCMNRFEAEHEGYTVVVEEIPADASGRAEMLQRIRTELMAGKGPDVLLLQNAYSDLDKLNPREPFLDDMQLAMQNGLFYDISEFYDADTELKTEELQPVIMEAGVLDGERYVLPFRFDIPVMFVEKNRFAQTGLSEDIFQKNILELMDYFVSMEDHATAINFYLQWIYPQFTMNVFPQLFDYEEGTVAVTREEIEAFLRAHQAYRVRFMQATSYGETADATSVKKYVRDGKYWTKETDNFLLIHCLQNAVETMAIGKMKEAELAVYPLRSMDGSVVADITFYGAVSAGCRNPELAYDFLRSFLTEDYQWERNTVQNGSDWSLATYGWPVRTKGSFGEVAKSAQEASQVVYIPQKYAIDFGVLTNEDLPIEELPVDSARFSIALEQKFWLALWTLDDINTKGPTDVDISQLAEEWIEKLQVHIEEG